MSNCEQTKGQSVLQHGESVKNYLFDLIDHLRLNKDLKYDWQLPKWLLENREIFLNNLPYDGTLELYTIFHDCGKPFCLEVDSDGKIHFPNHSSVSYDIFKSVFNDDLAADLILHDMDIHLLKSDGVEEFSKNTKALTLLLAGLAEIHSNSDMFGGKDSTSFKIKWKSINQRGKQILNIVKTHY